MSTWGIQIVPKRIDDNEGRNFHGVLFSFNLAKGESRSRFFYSDPELNEFIASHPNLKNTRMGYTYYLVHPAEKITERVLYYPYASFSDHWNPLHQEALKVLRGKGITYYLWRQTVRYLREKYPGYKYKESEGSSATIYPFSRQLEMLSITPGQAMPMGDVLKKLQNKARQHRKTKIRT